jgi:Tfp pilus assembly protein PilX
VKGFALPAAVLAVLLIAALIAGAFSATTEETRMGAAAAERQLALVSAESAIESTITELTALSADSIGVGDTRSWPVHGLGAPAVAYVTRLDSSLYWIVADAGDDSRSSGIARRVGVLVRATTGPGNSIAIERVPERAWSELF